mgnify:CR=1 FL=1
MEEFEIPYLIDEPEIDYEIISQEFIKLDCFLDWHRHMHGHSLVEFIKEDGDEINNFNICDWLHTCRMELSDGANELIQYHLDNENYEIIPQIKAQESKLRVEALQMEMNLEKFI